MQFNLYLFSSHLQATVKHKILLKSAIVLTFFQATARYYTLQCYVCLAAVCEWSLPWADLAVS